MCCCDHISSPRRSKQRHKWRVPFGSSLKARRRFLREPRSRSIEDRPRTMAKQGSEVLCCKVGASCLESFEGNPTKQIHVRPSKWSAPCFSSSAGFCFRFPSSFFFPFLRVFFFCFLIFLFQGLISASRAKQVVFPCRFQVQQDMAAGQQWYHSGCQVNSPPFAKRGVWSPFASPGGLGQGGHEEAEDLPRAGPKCGFSLVGARERT